MENEKLLELLNTYVNDDWSESVQDWFYHFKEGKTANGAFKMCLIFDKLDYVVKIPFSYDKDERTGACEIEIKLYESAKEAGLEKIFLETWFIGFLKNGCPVYGQPKISCIVSQTPKEKKKKYQRIARTVPYALSEKVRCGIYDRSVDEIWRNLAISLYGKKFMLAFEKWTHKTSLRDFHNENIGYLNDRPVILDYNYCR